MMSSIVASLYKVQYEQGTVLIIVVVVVGAASAAVELRYDVLCTCVCLKFPGVGFCQELAKLDDI